jgi:hypothetical protein
MKSSERKPTAGHCRGPEFPPFPPEFFLERLINHIPVDVQRIDIASRRVWGMRKAPVLVPECHGPEPAERTCQADRYRRVPKNPFNLGSPSHSASAIGRARGWRRAKPYVLRYSALAMHLSRRCLAPASRSVPLPASNAGRCVASEPLERPAADLCRPLLCETNRSHNLTVPICKSGQKDSCDVEP